MKHSLLVAAIACASFASPAISAIGDTSTEQHIPIPPKAFDEDPTFSPFVSRVDRSAEECSTDKFITKDSSKLIEGLNSQAYECLRPLFAGDSVLEKQVFTNEHLINVAKHVARKAVNYAGNGDHELRVLYTYLRGGFYVEFYNPSITLSSKVREEVKLAIDAFANNAHFYDKNAQHALVLEEVVTAMDSINLPHVYVDTATQWLQRWDDSYASVDNMARAINDYFSLLDRGQTTNNEAYLKKVENHSALVNALSNLTLRKPSEESDEAVIVTNAARALAHLLLLSKPGETPKPIEPLVVDKLKLIFNEPLRVGPGDSVWLTAANVISYIDRRAGNDTRCRQFNICGFEKTLKPKVLKENHLCSGSITLLYHTMTPTQTTSACDSVAKQATHFHSLLQTSHTPVKDDHNEQLNIKLFNSVSDYEKYVGILFDIETDNGGIYLEGDPSKKGNQANFIAYQYEPYSPDAAAHKVWNLEHELVHYLDGRFNLYGDFNAPTAPVIWWAEGLAEYVSKDKANPEALATLQDGSTYTLAAIFESNYDGFDVDRIYRWGYLAVRFMFEDYKADVNKMLEHTRVGDWAKYKAEVKTWAKTKQQEFEQWQCNLGKGGNAAIHIASNVTAKEGEQVTFDSRSCTSNPFNATEYVWSFGDGTSSSSAAPTHRFTVPKSSEEGVVKTSHTFTVTLQAKDSSGNISTSKTVVEVTKDSGSVTPPTPTPTPTPAPAPESDSSKSNGAGGGIIMFLIVAIGRIVLARNKRIE